MHQLEEGIACDRMCAIVDSQGALLGRGPRALGLAEEFQNLPPAQARM